MGLLLAARAVKLAVEGIRGSLPLMTGWVGDDGHQRAAGAMTGAAILGTRRLAVWTEHTESIQTFSVVSGIPNMKTR